MSVQPLVWQRSQLRVVRKLAAGGEGTVFEVVGPNRQTMAFKEYKAKALRSHGAATEKKLLAMVAHPPADPSSRPDHQTFLWPKAVIRDGGVLSGFCMPLLLGTWRKPLDIVDPRARRDSGVANWHWGARATVCLNLAHAVAALHAAGVAWGDINEENAVVNSSGLVTLLDLDTAAFRAPDGTHYPGSGVVRPDWCPPEHSPTSGYTVEGDRWALAVQIYILLMEGQRPYAAAGYQLEPAEHIARGLFPVVDPRVKPPVISPPLDLLPPDLRELFRRCFGPGRTSPDLRPAPGEFGDVLAGLLGQLRTCRTDRAHVWAPPRNTCPWCERLAAARAAAATQTGTSAAPIPGTVPPRVPGLAATTLVPTPHPQVTVPTPRPLAPTSAPVPWLVSVRVSQPAPVSSVAQVKSIGSAAKAWLAALVACVVVIGAVVFSSESDELRGAFGNSAPAQQQSAQFVGDLGLRTPISAPSCVGQFVVFVGAAVQPVTYQSDIGQLLARFPGTDYLLTEATCSSLAPKSPYLN